MQVGAGGAGGFPGLGPRGPRPGAGRPGCLLPEVTRGPPAPVGVCAKSTGALAELGAVLRPGVRPAVLGPGWASGGGREEPRSL